MEQNLGHGHSRHHLPTRGKKPRGTAVAAVLRTGIPDTAEQNTQEWEVSRAGERAPSKKKYLNQYVVEASKVNMIDDIVISFTKSKIDRQEECRGRWEMFEERRMHVSNPTEK